MSDTGKPDQPDVRQEKPKPAEDQAKPAEDSPRSSWMADLAKSAFNSAIGDPLRGVAQIGDSLFHTHADQSLKSAFSSAGLESPQKATFGTANWYAQQIGGGFGMMVPFMGTRRLIMGKAFGEAALLEADAGFMSKGMFGSAAKESFLSGASGMFTGTVLTPSDEKNVGTWNMALDRIKQGGADAATFGMIGFVNPYMTRGFAAAGNAISRPLADTFLADTLPISENLSAKLLPAQKIVGRALSGPLLPGVLSGVPAGAINAEAGAIKDGRLVATGDEFKESIVGNAIIGGAFGVAHRLTGPRQASVDVSSIRNERLAKLLKDIAIEHDDILPYSWSDSGNIMLHEESRRLRIHNYIDGELVEHERRTPPEPQKPGPPPPLLDVQPEHLAAVAEFHPSMNQNVADHLIQGVSYAFPNDITQQAAAIKNVDAKTYAHNLKQLGLTDEVNTRTATEAYRFTGVFGDADLKTIRDLHYSFRPYSSEGQVPNWLPVSSDANANLRSLGNWFQTNVEHLTYHSAENLSKSWLQLDDSIKSLPPEKLLKLAEVAGTYRYFNYNPYIDASDKSKDEHFADNGLNSQSAEMVNSGLGQMESLTHRQRQALVAYEYYHPGSLKALAQFEQGAPGTIESAAKALELQSKLPLADAIDIGRLSAIERAAMQMSYTPGGDAKALMNEALAKGDQYVWTNNPNLELAIEQANPELSSQQRRILQEIYGVVSEAREMSIFYGKDSANTVADESAISVYDITKLDGSALIAALNHLDVAERNSSNIQGGGLKSDYQRLSTITDSSHGMDEYYRRHEANTRMSSLTAARGAYRLSALFGDSWQEATQAFDWKTATAKEFGEIDSDHWINDNVPVRRPSEMRALGEWMLDHKDEHPAAEQMERIAQHWFHLSKDFRDMPVETLLGHIDTIDEHLQSVSEKSGNDELNNRFGYSAMNLGRGQLAPGEVVTLQRALREQQLMTCLDALVTHGDVQVAVPTVEEIRRAIPAWQINPAIPIEIATKMDLPAWVADATRHETKVKQTKPDDDAANARQELINKAQNSSNPDDRNAWVTSVQQMIDRVQGNGRQAYLAGNSLDPISASREYLTNLDESTRQMVAATASKEIKTNKQSDAHIAGMNGQLFKEMAEHLDKPRFDLLNELYEKRLPSDVYFSNIDMAIAPSPLVLSLKLSTIFADQPADAVKTWVDAIRQKEFDQATAEGNPKAEHIFETSTSEINDALPMASKADVKGLSDWLLANSNFSPKQFSPVAKNWTQISQPIRELPPEELVRQMTILETGLKKSNNPAWNAGEETPNGKKFATRIRKAAQVDDHTAGLTVINAGYGNLPVRDLKVLHAVTALSPEILQSADRPQIVAALKGWRVDPTFPIEIAQQVASMATQSDRVAARIAWDQFKSDDLQRDASGNVSADTISKFQDALSAVQQKGTREIGSHAKDMIEAVQIFHPPLSEVDQMLLARALTTHRLSHIEDARIVEGIDAKAFQSALDDLDSGGFFDNLRTLHTQPRRLNTELLEAGRRIDPTFPTELAIQVAKLPTPEHQEAAKQAWTKVKADMPELDRAEKLPPAGKEALKRQFLQIKKTLGSGQDLTAGNFEERKFSSESNPDLLNRMSAAMDIPNERASALLSMFNVDLIERALDSFDTEAARKNSLRSRARTALATDDVQTTNQLLGNIIDNSSWQHSAAASLASTMGQRTPVWLAEMAKKGFDSHDSSEWLPVGEPSRVAGLSDWLLDPRHIGRVNESNISITLRKIHQDGTAVKMIVPITGMEALRAVAPRWQGLNEKERALPFEKLVTRAMSNKYENVEHEDFADMSSAVSVQPGKREGQFEYNQKRFLASQNTPSPFPMLSEELSPWQSGNLVGVFLPRDDVRGVYLGNLLSCCQHPIGAARNTAWYGQESPNGGFFAVVRKDNLQKIIAGSAAIVSSDGGMVLDSIEGARVNGDGYHKGEPNYANDVANIYEMMAKDVVKEMFHRVTVARAGNAHVDFSRWPQAAKGSALKHALDFSAYTDVREGNQSILAENPQIPKIPPPQVPYVRGSNLNDVEIAQKIAKQVYPDGDQWVPGGDFGYILNDAKGQPIGYAVLDLANHQINDIAVLKGNRGAASKVLIDAVKNKIVQVGGEWGADARESTSYKMLQYLARKHVIQFTSEPEIIRHMGSDDKKEPVYRVRFKAYEPDEAQPPAENSTDSTSVAVQA